MTIADHTIYLQGGPVGIVLVHGLGGTPVEMKALARGLHAVGHTVLCCQLAGHCGTEEDILQTHWQDWRDSVVTAIDILKAECNEVFVGGISMGALLALQGARVRSEAISGVLLYGPTLWYDGWSVPKYEFILRWLINTPMGRAYRFVEREPYGLKDERLRELIRTAMESGASADAGLHATPSGSLRELWRLVDDIKPVLNTIKTPALVVHAREDDISSLSNAFYLQQHLGGLVDVVVLDDSYHLVMIDRQRDIVVSRSIQFITNVQEHKAKQERIAKRRQDVVDRRREQDG
jgi:carboxylesterase